MNGVDIRAYRNRLVVLSAGEDVTYVYGERPDSGEFQYLQVVTAFCDAAPSGAMRWFIDGHGYEHEIAEQLTVVANTRYFLTEDFYIGPGERLGVRVAGLASGKKLEVHLSGLKLYTKGFGLTLDQVEFSLTGARVIPQSPT